MSDDEWTPEQIEQTLYGNTRVKVSGCDIDGVSRGKIMAASKFVKCLNDGFGFCNVIFGWDINDKLYDVTAGAESDGGYSDIAARVDIQTIRRIPWENQQPFFLVDFYNPVTNEPYELCPRSLLKRILKEYEKDGHKVLCGMEFEWYNFRETSDTLAEKNGVGLTPLTRGMFGYSLLRPAANKEFFESIFDELLKFDIPIEALHTETGPGVFEAALEYTEALKLADRAHLFKTSVKQLALKHNIIASFMAKPWADLPGCSGHIHFSLADIQSLANQFVDNEGGSKHGLEGVSSLMKWFIAGLLDGLPSIMPFLAPTVNSYKRLVENYWAPVTVSWGFENRTTAIRVIAPPTSSPKATRIEVRVPGADVNPYLAIAAILACGLRGVREKMEPKVPPSEGGVTSSSGERLARNLKEATDKMMEDGSVARKVLGDAFVNHFGATRRHEWKQWETAVTNWELKRYMELV